VTVVPFVSLGMYPFDPIVGAWERLWSVVHQHAPWTPAALTWTGDVQADWRTPHCVVSQACGWPVAAQLQGVVDVVGAFRLTIPDARGHLYRSVLVGSRPDVLERVGEPELVAAANSEDSLSGWVSLLAGVGRHHWPGPVHWTGAHIHSLAALAQGRADLACIDALTLAHLSAANPTLTAGLHPVGYGPWIPSPAIVVRPGTPDEHRRQLADGLRAAVTDPAIGGPLHFDGFVELDHHAYEPTLHLVPA
jgi:hypothetical protein